MDTTAMIESVQTFKCKQCDIAFDSRKELGKHVYETHNKPFVKEKKFVVPLEKVDEFKYLGIGSYAKITLEGIITENGFEVDRFKYA